MSAALKSLLPLLALCLCVGVPKLPLRLWLAKTGVSNTVLLLLLSLDAADVGVVCVLWEGFAMGAVMSLRENTLCHITLNCQFGGYKY